MGRFVKEVTLDPKEIPKMSLSQKQDCMAEIEKRRKQAWVYSLLFSFGIMVFLLLYSLISIVYTLRFNTLLVNVNIFMFLVPFVALVPSIFAHMMNGKCVVFTVIAYMAIGLFTIFTGELVNGWVAIFAFAGAVMYFRLSRSCDAYYALEKEEGFPDFCEIESNVDAAKAIIERNTKKEEPLNILTEAAILTAKKAMEKEQVKEENQSTD